MMNEINTEYWELLNLTEDYLRGGTRRPHGAPPELRRPGDRRDTPQSPAGIAGQRSHSVQEVAGRKVPAGPLGGGADREERSRSLAAVAGEIGVCEKCGLCSGRNHVVPGEGVLDPLVMVIGEGPGADEDRTGRPFVGRAGQYLDKWLAAIELSRDTNAFIGNVVKCRPPGNRDPLPDESIACRPYLDRQIEIIRPKAILTVGRIAAQQLLGTETGIGRLRGTTYRYNGTPLMATYHPSGVLRNPTLRAAVWEDLKRLRSFLDESSDGE